MYTSVDHEKTIKRTALIYVFATCFTALFGAVYEIFGHGVYSYYMIYAFAFPLMLGVVPYMIMLSSDKYGFPGALSYKAWNSGVAVLTVGCLYKGVLDIYGTTNGLIYVYPVAGTVFIVTGIAAYVAKKGETTKVSDRPSADETG